MKDKNTVSVLTLALDSDDLHDGAEIKLPREEKPDEK